MEHSVNILLCICCITFIDYLSSVLHCIVYRMITLFVQLLSKFFQTSRREQWMVTQFESPKEIRERQKGMLNLVFMSIPFTSHSTLEY